MSKKFGLGKGLGALIPETEDDIKESNNLFIPLNKIKNNAEQPRKAFDNEKIAELAESVKTHGIIQPLLVKRSDSDEYIISDYWSEQLNKSDASQTIKTLLAIFTDKIENKIVKEEQKKMLQAKTSDKNGGKCVMDCRIYLIEKGIEK